ncbi:MAG: hypothetical protein EOP06_14265, partial [Proteobacteria bacterium]
MNMLVRLTLTLLVLSSLSVFAEAGVLYKAVLKNSIPGFYVATQGYSDLRSKSVSTDSTLRWIVRRENTVVDQVRDSGGVRTLLIKKEYPKYVHEILYERKGRGLVRTFARTRRPTISFMAELSLSNDGSLCPKANSSVEEIKSIAKKIDGARIEENLEDGVIDPVCKSNLAEGQYERLLTAYSIALAPDNALVKCLSDVTKLKTLAPQKTAPRSADQKDILLSIGLRYVMEMDKFSKLPKSLNKHITCRKSPKIPPIASTLEGGAMTFYYSDGEMPDQKTMNKAAVHELLHSVGVIDENLVGNITAVCLENANQIASSATEMQAQGLNNAGNGTVFQSEAMIASTVKDAAGNIDAVIPKTLAE